MSDHHHEPPVPGLAELRRDRQPEHDLWPAIHGRIGRRRRQRHRYAWIGGLAAAATVTALTLPVLWQMQAPMPQGSERSFVAPSLLPTVPRPRSHPERALIKANLQIASGAERQLRRALAAEPGAAYLHRMLIDVRAQRQQLQLALNDTTSD